jgi:hypothetical protein
MAYEALVAWNIHDAEQVVIREPHVGEPKLDSDSTQLLFLQPIRIDSRKRPYEGRFPMVYVTRGA